MSNRLLRGVAALAIALGALAFPSAEPSRAASAECTGWTSSLVPPTSIRVYRTAARRTVTVPFRAYVETVMASEWGRTAPDAALRIGAIAVKQYGWYFAMVWRGGRDPAGRCYDVVDSTRDQLYLPGRPLVPSHLAAIEATWRVSLRKGDRFIMTGYRPGTGSCTANLDGWRLYQRDAVDCVRRYGDTAETLARRFYSWVSWVVPGAGDYTGDGRGDLAAISVTPDTGETTARIYTADTAFRATLASTAASVSSSIVASAAATGNAVATTPPERLLGRAAGDVDADGRSDLVQLVRTDDGIALEVMLGSDGGLQPATTWWREVIAPTPADPAPTDPATPDPATPDPGTVPPTVSPEAYRLVVADFTGDGRADAGIVRLRPATPPETPDAPGSPPSTALEVAASSGADFQPVVRTWAVAADLTTSTFLAGDLSGDGRGDLVVLTPSLEAATTDLAVAESRPSGLLADLASWGTEPSAPDAFRVLVGDATRDGRDDLIVIRRSGEDGIRVVVQRSSSDAAGTSSMAFSPLYFTDPLPISFAGSRFSTADLTGDGRADLVALVDRGVDEVGLPLGSDAWRFVSDGRSFTPTAWFSDPALAWGTTFPY